MTLDLPPFFFPPADEAKPSELAAAPALLLTTAFFFAFPRKVRPACWSCFNFSNFCCCIIHMSSSHTLNSIRSDLKQLSCTCSTERHTRERAREREVLEAVAALPCLAACSHTCKTFQ